MAIAALVISIVGLVGNLLYYWYTSGRLREANLLQGQSVQHAADSKQAAKESAESAKEALKAERLKEQMKAYRTIRKVFLLTGGFEGKEFEFSIDDEYDKIIGKNEIVSWQEPVKSKLVFHNLTLSIDLFNDYLSSLLVYDKLFPPTQCIDKTIAIIVYENFTKRSTPLIFPKKGVVGYSHKDRIELSIGISQLMTHMQNYLDTELLK